MLFCEKQKFTQWWLWLLLIGLSVTCLIPILVTIITTEGTKNSGDINSMVLIALVTIILLPLLFFSLVTLNTQISAGEIAVQFKPFSSFTIPWHDVQSAEVLNYGFVGGWGVRWGTKYGTVYNTRGRMGLVLRLKSGKKICIGTQAPYQLASIIENINPAFTSDSL